MPQAKNVAAILDWCKQYRPDMVAQMERVIDIPGVQGEAFILLMTCSFEAGRMFQSTVVSPNTYAPHDVDYLMPVTGRN